MVLCPICNGSGTDDDGNVCEYCGGPGYDPFGYGDDDFEDEMPAL